MKVCPKCNAEVEDDDNFCPFCGIKVKSKKTLLRTKLLVFLFLSLIIIILISYFYVYNTYNFSKELSRRLPVRQDLNINTLVKEIHRTILTHNYESLNELVEERKISFDVFKDLSNILETEADFSFIVSRSSLLNIKNSMQNDHLKLDVFVYISTPDQRIKQTTFWTFKKVNSSKNEDYWMLTKIDPPLSDIKLSKPVEKYPFVKMKRLKHVLEEFS